jgi:hypothetical protein
MGSEIIRNDERAYVVMGRNHIYVSCPRGLKGGGDMVWWGPLHWLLSFTNAPHHYSFLTFEQARRFALNLVRHPRPKMPEVVVVNPRVEQMRRDFAA